MSPARVVAARFGALSPAVRGTLWMLVGLTAMTVMGVLAKLAGARLDSLQIVFFRASFGLVVLLPFLFRDGLASLRTSRFPAHFGRAIAGTLGMTSGFYAFTHLPLADAVALSFTKPLFLVVLAVVVLHETVRWRRWSATLVGFGGVLIMVQPGAAAWQPAVGVALLGSLCVAIVMITIKSLARTEEPLVILIWFGIISSLLTLTGAIMVWQTPTMTELLILLSMAGVGVSGQAATIRALRIVEASAIAPLDYLRLPVSALLAFLVFAEVPTIHTAIGALVIVASSLYITRREVALQKPANPPPGAVV